MIAIPLYIFLFLYLLFLCVFLIFALINFYHIVMTASFTFASFIISFFVFVLTILTLYFTWQLMADIEWQRQVILFDPTWFQ